MNWADRIVWARDHPELYPLPRRSEVCGLPADEQVLAVMAHNPGLAARSLAAWARLGVVPTGAVPAVVVERPADLAVRGRRVAAEVIVAGSALTVDEALAVVEAHGPVSPARAVREHRRMKEQS